MISRQAIIARARQELLTTYPGKLRKGTRWQHQARVLGVAVDCIGLVGATASACGVPGAQAWLQDEDLKRYGRIPDPDKLLAGARKYMQEISVAEVLPADVLVMAHRRSREHQTHFAIVTSNNPLCIIHSEAFAKRVVENSLPATSYWIPTNAFRFHGVA